MAPVPAAQPQASWISAHRQNRAQIHQAQTSRRARAQNGTWPFGFRVSGIRRHPKAPSPDDPLAADLRKSWAGGGVWNR